MPSLREIENLQSEVSTKERSNRSLMSIIFSVLRKNFCRRRKREMIELNESARCCELKRWEEDEPQWISFTQFTQKNCAMIVICPNLSPSCCCLHSCFRRGSMNSSAEWGLASGCLALDGSLGHGYLITSNFLSSWSHRSRQNAELNKLFGLWVCNSIRVWALFWK